MIAITTRAAHGTGPRQPTLPAPSDPRPPGPADPRVPGPADPPAPGPADPPPPPQADPPLAAPGPPRAGSPPGPVSPASLFQQHRAAAIAGLCVVTIAAHLLLRHVLHAPAARYDLPLFVALLFGGLPQLFELARKLLRHEFGADLLGGISIFSSIALGEYLAGAIIVLMLASGAALERYALRSANSVLAALAKRMPSVAHRRVGTVLEDVTLEEVRIGDTLVLYPHDICPVDGIVVEGHGGMDEAYLTGEPFQITKTIGSTVISGAVNGESALTLRSTHLAVDSRFSKIMGVKRESEARRPHLRRLGDELGAWFTPLALVVALAAWAVSADPKRFLAVLVIATPCPLLLAIPIAIIGSITLCARRAIIIKSPAVLERIASCRTAIFDKTGTLTYGKPALAQQLTAPGFAPRDVLRWVASLERYSKHPLGRAVVKAALDQALVLSEGSEVHEQPGQGLRGRVGGHDLQITSRATLKAQTTSGATRIPPIAGGLECAVAVDGQYAAVMQFRDAPRAENRAFVTHLGPGHHFGRVMLLSGDRESEVRYLAEQVGISEVHAQQSPEQKLAIVRRETARMPTLYVGDGINDAPAMMAATVGIAIGQNSDVAAEAAGVVIMDNSLRRVDEFLHISVRMRRIALQSAVGGMALSVIGMGFAATGHLAPVSGAILQECIDLAAVLNALRAAFPPRTLDDV